MTGGGDRCRVRQSFGPLVYHLAVQIRVFDNRREQRITTEAQRRISSCSLGHSALCLCASVVIPAFGHAAARGFLRTSSIPAAEHIMRNIGYKVRPQPSCPRSPPSCVDLTRSSPRHWHRPSGSHKLRRRLWGWPSLLPGSRPGTAVTGVTVPTQSTSVIWALVLHGNPRF